MVGRCEPSDRPFALAEDLLPPNGTTLIRARRAAGPVRTWADSRA